MKWSFFVKNKWQAAKAGDQLTVPIGVKHVFNTHQPALRMENYIEDVCKVLDIIIEGRTKAFSMPPRTMLYMSVLMNNYRQEIIAKSPPDVAIKLLGRVAGVMRLKY